MKSYQDKTISCDLKIFRKIIGYTWAEGQKMCCLQLRSNLNKQRVGYSETMVPIYRTTWFHIPDARLWWTNRYWDRFLSSSSSIGTTARCGLWPVEQYPSIFPYLSPTLSIIFKSLFDFRNNSFLLCGVVSPKPNPNLKDQVIPFCLGHHLWPVWHGRPYQ
jgi:hypothetical protein